MNDGTSCGLEDDEDEDGQPLVRNRNDTRLTHRAGGGGSGQISSSSSSSAQLKNNIRGGGKDMGTRQSNISPPSSNPNFSRRKGD